MRNIMRKQSGFTIIELLIVIAVLAIVAFWVLAAIVGFHFIAKLW